MHASLLFRSVLAVLLVVGAVGLAIIFSRQPKINRQWEDEFAVLPTISREGENITINNIHDWRYDHNGPISKEYISRTYRANAIERIWFLIEPFSKWDGVAHTYFVFDFVDKPPLAFSIEARREAGEKYDPFLGLFRKFELMYMWGTEEDFTVKRIINLNNDVYMFPLDSSAEFEQQLFEELINSTDQLTKQARFYNTLTSNCTNNLAIHANQVEPGAVPYHYARYLTGYSGPLLYELGYIGGAESYETLKEKYKITDFVKENHLDEDFSEKLREFLLEKSTE